MTLPKLNFDVCLIISKYLHKYKYELLEWLDISKIDWNSLSNNENAIELLTNNQEYINWGLLSFNPNAIQLFKENPDKIHWAIISKNPNAIELLKENPDKINWTMISTNINAIELIKQNLDNIIKDTNDVTSIIKQKKIA